jgi:phenylalanyl-tRNA synthetase alpha chain
MKESILDSIRNTELECYQDISISTSQEQLELVKIKYVGKNGLIKELTEQFKQCSLDEKKSIGNILVDMKKNIVEALHKKQNDLFLQEINFPCIEHFDPSLEKKTIYTGSLHPYTLSLELITNFFVSMGFEIIQGSIITDEYDNFTSLNIPQDHSARDEHDTFWVIEKKTLLRTHTSNIQVQAAKKRTVPFGIISPGIVYRNEATDMSHDFMFAQIEGMFFSEDASLSSLLFVLKKLLNVYFEKENLEIRARPGIFPFVEPGLEIDFECPFCMSGCSTCKYSRWIELGGAGMVHSFVKKEMGLSEQDTGWAFGMGLTRLTMLKYNINDIRKLHQSIILT